MARATIRGLLLAACLVAAPAGAAEIAGQTRVSDGDTLEIGATRIRLFGIDAPETGQLCADAAGRDWDCGAAARARMVALVAGQRVRCAPVDRDRYGRVVARCAAAGVDLGGTLVTEGLAWAYTRYGADYAAAEAEARAAKRGLWQGKAQVAWDYRAGGFTEAAGGGNRECAIKGNINAEGTKIYHLPGTRWYPGIRVTETAGERWFCDEAEAKAAGWRAAKTH